MQRCKKSCCSLLFVSSPLAIGKKRCAHICSYFRLFYSCFFCDFLFPLLHFATAFSSFYSSFRDEQRRRPDVFFSAGKMKNLCRFCECPVAEGGVLLSEVDQDALSSWWSKCLHTELVAETLKDAWSCRQCVADAR